MQSHPSEADAFAAEIMLIAFYGRKDEGTGILRNMSDGGSGGAVHTKPHSEATKKAWSEKRKGKIPWEATRAAAVANTGKKRTEEAKSHMRKPRTQPRSLSHCRKLAAAARLRVATMPRMAGRFVRKESSQ